MKREPTNTLFIIQDSTNILNILYLWIQTIKCVWMFKREIASKRKLAWRKRYKNTTTLVLCQLLFLLSYKLRYRLYDIETCIINALYLSSQMKTRGLHAFNDHAINRCRMISSTYSSYYCENLILKGFCIYWILFESSLVYKISGPLIIALSITSIKVQHVTYCSNLSSLSPDEYCNSLDFVLGSSVYNT